MQQLSLVVGLGKLPIAVLDPKAPIRRHCTSLSRDNGAPGRERQWHKNASISTHRVSLQSGSWWTK